MNGVSPDDGAYGYAYAANERGSRRSRAGGRRRRRRRPEPVRVLVTGGGGFIGSHLAERLLRRRPRRPRARQLRDRPAREPRARSRGDVELVEGDIQSYERVHNAVRGCEVVFHQAALPSVPRSVQDPLTSNATNVDRHAQRAARRARRAACGASSSRRRRRSTAPTRRCPSTRTWRPLPISPVRGRQARRRGLLPQLRRSVYGLETVALRYFNVFGPRQDPTVAVRGGDPELHHRAARRPARRRSTATASSRATSPTSTTSCEANLLAIDAPDVAGEVFNVACGERITLNELCAPSCRELTGADAEPEHAPAAARRRPPLARRHLARARRSSATSPGRPPRGPRRARSSTTASRSRRPCSTARS